MDPPNQLGHFSTNSYTDGIIPTNYSILCCISDSNLKYRTYLYRLLFEKLLWFCRNQPFHSPPRRAAIQPPATEASGAGPSWQAPHLYTRTAVFKGNPSHPDRRKNSPADDPGCFFREIPLQIVLSLQNYTDQATAALVDDPFDDFEGQFSGTYLIHILAHTRKSWYPVTEECMQHSLQD